MVPQNVFVQGCQSHIWDHVVGGKAVSGVFSPCFLRGGWWGSHNFSQMDTQMKTGSVSLLMMYRTISVLHWKSALFRKEIME